ncbi:MotA/TolQ/ExbB proton channel family protein [Leucothrix pacifica]|uniref:MotA/TolQ/ExbB proton channel domain-containing protein n=1 Tax=Leucothrix pacifica TaxID=1247513 RepID=A0A317CKP3_9GAMM|nr:MotA/TolQ/ExbB proton channel family protein [Leucothrix pacifica]PWQ99128.1 hypothetical protein DKW60_06755 [Leucothrix pacifica]
MIIAPHNKCGRIDSYRPLYGWLVLFGLMLFGGFLLWWHELWQPVLTQDKTYLSGVIIILFILVTLYLGRCTWQLTQQSLLAEDLINAPHTNENTQQHNSGTSTQKTEHSSLNTQGWASEYLHLLQQSQQQTDKGQNLTESLQARLVEQVYGPHSSGWFLSDLLLRLGLMGTVIGFVLMLGSVVNLQDEGINALKQLMTSMSSGMQVALLTTLTGLGSAMLISLQCQWLDRCADQLVSRIIEISTFNVSSTNGHHTESH